VNDLTIVMAVYGQPEMLWFQIKLMETYPEDVLKRLNVIVVDDCGNPPVNEKWIIELGLFVKKVQLFRVDEDIHWNQMGARNLAMHHAEGWCVMLDPDMVFSGEMMQKLLLTIGQLERGHVVKWALRHVGNGVVDMTSPNTWLIHRDDFFAIGGYDEDYAGHKGWSDVQLLDVLRSCYKIHQRPDIQADFYSNKQVPDAAVTSLDRSTGANRKKRLRKAAEARGARGWKQWAKTRQKIPRLRFKWRRVYPPPV